MKVTVRLQGETVTWVDDNVCDDTSREAFLSWVRSQVYDRCVREIHMDISYLGPLLPLRSNSPSDY